MREWARLSGGLGWEGDTPAGHSVNSSFPQGPATTLTSPESGPVSPSQVGEVGVCRCLHVDVHTSPWSRLPSHWREASTEGYRWFTIRKQTSRHLRLFRLHVTCLFFYNLGGHVCPSGGLSQCTVFPSELAPLVPGLPAEPSKGQELG